MRGSRPHRKTCHELLCQENVAPHIRAGADCAACVVAVSQPVCRRRSPLCRPKWDRRGQWLDPEAERPRMIFDSYEAYRAASFVPKVCILGSGPAGTTMARKLGAAGIPVVVLEAGS